MRPMTPGPPHARLKLFAYCLSLSCPVLSGQERLERFLADADRPADVDGTKLPGGNGAVNRPDTHLQAIGSILSREQAMPSWWFRFGCFMGFGHRHSPKAETKPPCRPELPPPPGAPAAGQVRQKGGWDEKEQPIRNQLGAARPALTAYAEGFFLLAMNGRAARRRSL